MGKRKPRISTRRGNDGTTGLLGIGRMPKSDVRVALLGDVDEASSFLGLARTEAGETNQAAVEVGGLLLEVQRLLYRTMSDVEMPEEKNAVGEEDLAFVESVFEEWRDRTEIPGEFVVPGEGRLGALLDVSRAVARRAERSAVAAGFARDHPEGLRILNRLSDLLFVVARHADGEATPSKR